MGCFGDCIKYFLMNIVSIPLMILSTPTRWVYEFFDVYHPDLFRTRNTPAKHLKKVEAVQSQVVEWNKNGRKKLMCTARPTWKTLSLRELDKSKFAQIKIHLEDIIEIDTEEKVIRVEPGIKMGTLTYKLISLGWTIPVIPELESLSIGGLVCGTGIETSSHKWGLFADACLEFELVLADGSLVTCSKGTNSDLFYSIPWSHGTIGFLTAVTIKLLPAPKYVRMEYHVATSVSEAQKLLQRDEFDFLEGIAYSLDKIVVIHGKFVEKPEPGKINSLNRWYKPFFYKHVESVLTKPGGKYVDYIPSRDYYHRHQRAFFWELAVSFPLGNNAIIRYLIGWVFPINYPMVKRIAVPKFRDWLVGDRHLLQDFLVPMNELENILKLSHEELQRYPIWLCPCKFFKHPGLARLRNDADEMYVDIGIYGISPIKGEFDIEAKTRKLEKFTTECKGFQFLYADTYMTRKEFREMFDMEYYDRIRKKYNCKDAFPEIYDKVSISARK